MAVMNRVVGAMCTLLSCVARLAIADPGGVRYRTNSAAERRSRAYETPAEELEGIDSSVPWPPGC